jgi:hypothetical protein
MDGNFGSPTAPGRAIEDKLDAKQDLAVKEEKRKKAKNAMSLFAKPVHKAVARAIGYALTLGDEAAWHGLTIVLMARLSERERAALAYAALMSLSDAHAAAVAEVAG